MLPASKTALKAMKVAEIKQFLNAHGKNTKGKKAELMKRVEQLCE